MNLRQQASVAAEHRTENTPSSSEGLLGEASVAKETLGRLDEFGSIPRLNNTLRHNLTTQKLHRCEQCSKTREYTISVTTSLQAGPKKNLLVHHRLLH